MKTSLMLYLAALLGAASASSGIVDQSEVRSMHNNWMLKHSKSYATEEEKESRFNVFMKNLEMILEHNMRFSLGHTSYTMEMNAHGDMTFEEWKAAKLSWKAPAASKNIILSMFSDGHAGVHTTPLIRGIELPDSVDWRAKGAVTPVKDQAQCGSCWSFSTTGAIEGAYFLKTGKLTPLSEEQLINCVNGGAYDCNSGGDMVEAFKYVIQNNGIVSEASFPYTSADHKTCTYKPYSGSGTNPYVATITGYKTVTSNDEDALKSAVAQQPVSVAIDASQNSFQFYSSGVYDEPACCTNCQQSDLDHGVLVVGYGTEDGKDYWLVKNSWNSGWGDNGYIKMLRNADGQCGVPAYPSYPIA